MDNVKQCYIIWDKETGLPRQATEQERTQSLAAKTLRYDVSVESKGAVWAKKVVQEGFGVTLTGNENNILYNNLLHY